MSKCRKKTERVIGLILTVSLIVGYIYAIFSSLPTNGDSNDENYNESVMRLTYDVLGIEEVGDQSVILISNGRSYHISAEAVEQLHIGDTCTFLYTRKGWLDDKYIIGAFCDGE